MAPPLHKSIRNPKAFSRSVDAYIQSCLIKDDKGRDSRLITMSGLALALGCDSDSLLNWRRRYAEPTEHDPQLHIVGALKKATESSNEQLRQDCFKNKNAMALALGKCMHGWIEEQHIKHDVAGGVTIAISTGVQLGGKADATTE